MKLAAPAEHFAKWWTDPYGWAAEWWRDMAEREEAKMKRKEQQNG